MKESEIKKQILDALNRCHRTFAFPIYSTGLPDGKGGFRKNHHKGVADIIGIKGVEKFKKITGIPFAFEVKAENGKLMDHQKVWLLKFAEAGGWSYVVRSVKDAIEAYDEISL